MRLNHSVPNYDVNQGKSLSIYLESHEINLCSLNLSRKFNVQIVTEQIMNVYENLCQTKFIISEDTSSRKKKPPSTKICPKFHQVSVDQFDS